MILLTENLCLKKAGRSPQVPIMSVFSARCGVTDVKQAVAWYQLAVAQGYAAAQSALGHVYRQKDGDNQNVALALPRF